MMDWLASGRYPIAFGLPSATFVDYAARGASIADFVKVQGLHFCGRAYYDVPLVEGFQSLALIVPATLYLARWLAASDRRTTLTVEDVSRALATADHHHGYSPIFGQSGFRRRVRMLARMDAISKLCAWYAR